MPWKNKQGEGHEYTQGERWFILYNYLVRNTGKERKLTSTEILKYLKTQNVVISLHTLYTDLATLQGEIFGLDIQFDKSANKGAGGWWVKNPPFEPYELRLMVDSVQSSKFITQTAANQITKKIKKFVGEAYRHELERPAAVSNRVRSMNESVVKDTDSIFTAISRNSKISFRYFHRSPNRNNPVKYVKDGLQVIVSPFAMLWDNGNYYLYAHDGKRFRTYRIDRMDRINLLPDKRDGVEEYNAKELTQQKATVFEMYRGPEYSIKFRCHNRMADAVIDKFGDVRLMPEDENYFTFTANVEISPPFFAWVATFGRMIKIISPDPAVKGMKEFLQKSAEMYQDV